MSLFWLWCDSLVEISRKSVQESRIKVFEELTCSRKQQKKKNYVEKGKWDWRRRKIFSMEETHAANLIVPVKMWRKTLKSSKSPQCSSSKNYTKIVSRLCDTEKWIILCREETVWRVFFLFLLRMTIESEILWKGISTTTTIPGKKRNKTVKVTWRKKRQLIGTQNTFSRWAQLQWCSSWFKAFCGLCFSWIGYVKTLDCATVWYFVWCENVNSVNPRRQRPTTSLHRLSRVKYFSFAHFIAALFFFGSVFNEIIMI